MWSKIRNLIRSITRNSDDYDEKLMKIKFHSDDELPLNKTIKFPSMIIVVRSVFFYENNKYYSQVFLDECLCILKTRIKQQNNLWKKKFLYFNCPFTNYNCIIDTC